MSGSELQGKLAEAAAAVAGLKQCCEEQRAKVKRLEHPNADEILASIEDFAERRELDFIDQRDRAIKAEAEVERLRALISAIREAALAVGVGIVYMGGVPIVSVNHEEMDA